MNNDGRCGPGKLAGRVGLVSGGTSGLSAAVARLFAAEGASVVATGSNPATLERERRELAGVEVVANEESDLTWDDALVSSIAARYGRIDVLVVDAGVAPRP